MRNKEKKKQISIRKKETIQYIKCLKERNQACFEKGQFEEIWIT